MRPETQTGGVTSCFFLCRVPVRVPGSLLKRPKVERYGFVILGAGCAGLSLAHYLLEEGWTSPS